ncbi:MAG: plasmid stabilization protein [Proteobacteria bacterium]|nr:plasmid stabilization protein [Pseudomonadota bacterium]MBU1688284.1 plasmid stabilization protein [Pseudomonadota bacterium]
MYTLTTPENFLRQARKFLRKHPDLKPRLTQVLTNLQHDPFQVELGLHPLAGKLAGCHAVRLNYSYRITLTLLISEQEIILLDIGSHDDVYR